jgi:hypothetical protein
MRISGWLALSSIFIISSTYAQVFRTLPKGVRLFEYRNVNTTEIDATYNQTQTARPLAYNVNADDQSLEDISETIKLYFQELRAISPGAYESMTFGEFKLSATAQVQVHGFGGGYGVTDRLTVFGILPYYNAQVKMKYKQLKAGNTQQVADQVQQSGQGDIDSTLANITGALPDANGNLLQSVVVNTFKYEEIGDWQGAGYGDLEMGAIYRLVDKGTWGIATTAGFKAPTGRVDDPDILQDFGFGDGQWDIFAEGAFGYVLNDNWMFGVTSRLTYQAPDNNRTLRVPGSREVPLSDRKDEFYVKLGDRMDNTLSATYSLNDWFSLTGAYEFNYQAASVFDSENEEANGWLARDTATQEQTARLTATVSSIQPFLKKKFILPASLYLNMQKTVTGQNIPEVTRVEVGFRMLF